jgi:hypothetical protein
MKCNFIIIDSFSSIMHMNMELGEYEEYLTHVYKLLKILSTSYSVGTIVKKFFSYNNHLGHYNCQISQ